MIPNQHKADLRAPDATCAKQKNQTLSIFLRTNTPTKLFVLR
uniref:Uncharacterized protein n=1 Tax=Anopheles dirus TaxID=7168 RepID=A0A182NWE9_9DIPT